jgi:hypothetical protein
LIFADLIALDTTPMLHTDPDTADLAELKALRGGLEAGPVDLVMELGPNGHVASTSRVTEDQARIVDLHPDDRRAKRQPDPPPAQGNARSGQHPRRRRGVLLVTGSAKAIWPPPSKVSRPRRTDQPPTDAPPTTVVRRRGGRLLGG